MSGGSTYGAQNKCANYGAMKATIDLQSGSDEHFHMSNGDKKRGADWTRNVKDIACCLNQSDLCKKNQVEKENGKIKVWTGTGTTMDTVNVSTHVKRYLYCNDNPDSIYCVNDEDGDAFTVPTLVCGPSDNRRECRARDCRSAFNHAENEYVDDYCTLDSYSYEDGFCTLDATCSGESVGDGSFSASNEIFLSHIKRYLEVCDGAEGYYLIHKDNDTCI